MSAIAISPSAIKTGTSGSRIPSKSNHPAHQQPEAAVRQTAPAFAPMFALPEEAASLPCSFIAHECDSWLRWMKLA